MGRPDVFRPNQPMILSYTINLKMISPSMSWFRNALLVVQEYYKRCIGASVRRYSINASGITYWISHLTFARVTMELKTLFLLLYIYPYLDISLINWDYDGVLFLLLRFQSNKSHRERHSFFCAVQVLKAIHNGCKLKQMYLILKQIYLPISCCWWNMRWRLWWRLYRSVRSFDMLG